MGRRTKSTDFFKALYEPVLLNAGIPSAIRRAKWRANAERLNASLTPEQRSARAQKAHAHLKERTPEKKKEDALKMNAAKYNSMSPEQRSKCASIASKAKWAAISPEKRKEMARNMANIRYRKQRWPFPERKKDAE